MNKSVRYFVFFALIAIIGLISSGCASFGSSGVTIRTQNNLSSVIRGGTLVCSSNARDVRWAVSSTADGTGTIASGTSIYDNGTLVISQSESLSSVYVIATSASSGTTANKQIRIVTVTDVTVSAAVQFVALGRTLQFRAQVTGSNAPDSNVTWSVSSNAAGSGYVATGTSISTSGLLTVSASETFRTLFITATSVVDPSRSGRASVSIVVPTITNVTIAPVNGNVRAGGTLQFSASVTGTNDPVTTVTWDVSSSQSGTGVVTSGTRIGSNGLLTVASRETFTILYVTATSTYDTSKFSRVSVSIIIPTITRISVGPTDQAVTVGNSLNFFATVEGTNNPDTSVTWKVSSNAAGNGPVASGTTVNSSGRLTVSSNETARILYVFATSVFDPSKSGNAVVVINSAPVTTTPTTTTPTTTTPTTTTPTTTTPTTTTPTVTRPTVTSVTVTPSSVSTQTNRNVQFSAAVSGTNNPASSVTWRVGPNSDGTGEISANTTVNTTGRLNIAANEWNTTLYVAAVSTVDPTKTGVAVVSVTNAGSNQRPTTTTQGTTRPPTTTTPTVTSVTVSPSAQSIIKGNTQQFSATVTGTNNPGTGVTWKASSNTAGTGSVTSGTSVNSSGLLTVSANETNTTIYVIATSSADTSKTGRATVTVNAPSPTVTGVTVSPSSQTIVRGNTQQFNATVTGTNNPGTGVTWKVSSNTAGTGSVTSGTSVSSSGLLTVSANETNTTLYVIATSTADTSKSGSATVSVNINTSTVTSISISPSSQNMMRGNTQQFTAIVRGNNNPSSSVTWKVSSNAAGTGSVSSTISSSGLLTIAANETITTLYVIATSTVDTSVSGSSIVSVYQLQ